MLKLLCPQCHAPLEAHDDDIGLKTRCSRCGHGFVVAQSAIAAETASVNPNSTPGESHAQLHPLFRMRAFRVAKKLTSRTRKCPYCGREISRQAGVCPNCERVFKKPSRRWRKAEWRTIAIATLIFVGLPIATIFFFVVLASARPSKAAGTAQARKERPRYGNGAVFALEPADGVLFLDESTGEVSANCRARRRQFQ